MDDPLTFTLRLTLAVAGGWLVGWAAGWVRIVFTRALSNICRPATLIERWLGILIIPVPFAVIEDAKAAIDREKLARHPAES